MRLLLTSNGINNITIEYELKRLLNKKSLKGMRLLFCSTASNYQGYDMSDWLVKDIIYFKNAGFQIDVCDINGISKDKFISRFEWADVLFFEGGNTQWLRECIRNTKLEDELLRLLEKKVWVGASAGSMVLCPSICNSVFDLYDSNIDGYSKDGLKIIDFIVMPHLNSCGFTKINIDNIKKASKNLNMSDGNKIYVLDDNSAVVVDGDAVRVVSEGTWYEI